MAKKRRRSRSRRRKKKTNIIPAILAVIFIMLIGGASVGALVYEKYSYSKEEMSLEEYFDMSNNSDKAILYMENERLEETAWINGSAIYLPYKWVKKNLNDRFYIDEKEELILYPLPNEVVSAPLTGASYTMDGQEVSLGNPLTEYVDGELYLLIDFVKGLTNFSYTLYEDPNRIQMYKNEVSYSYADVTKDSAVRYQGGVKSDILKNVSEGEKLQILEEYENWVNVRTEDTIEGFIEKKHLGETYEDTIEACKDVPKLEYTSITRDHKINMVWHQMIYEGGNDTFDDMTRAMSGVNVISPTWFFLCDEAGNIENISSSSYVVKAHNKGLEVWALVDNFTKSVDTTKVLSRTSTRQNLINNIVDATLKVGADGINVDFESLEVECGPHFVEFIRELSIPCRQNNLVLSVDNYVPMGNTEFYGRKAQGEACDYVIIMGYDEHWAGSEEAGSVASLDYVEHGITETLKDVPSEKIINAVPFYARFWTTKDGKVSSEALGMNEAKQTVDNRGLSVTWDDVTCQNYGVKEADGALYQIWLEDEESLAAKISIMKNYQVGGIAAWKLGLEKDDIWKTIETFLE